MAGMVAERLRCTSLPVDSSWVTIYLLEGTTTTFQDKGQLFEIETIDERTSSPLYSRRMKTTTNLKKMERCQLQSSASICQEYSRQLPRRLIWSIKCESSAVKNSCSNNKGRKASLHLQILQQLWLYLVLIETLMTWRTNKSLKIKSKLHQRRRSAVRWSETWLMIRSMILGRVCRLVQQLFASRLICSFQALAQSFYHVSFQQSSTRKTSKAIERERLRQLKSKRMQSCWAYSNFWQRRCYF